MVDLERDWNYVCAGCNGNLIIIEQDETGRDIYDCDGCGKNRMKSCSICKKPKSIWADNGLICGGCALRVLTSVEGEFTFSPEQQAAINEWKVTI